MESHDHALAIRMTRHRLRVEARKKGYSISQARRLTADVSDETILDRLKNFWAEHGDTIMAILKVAMMILSMFLAKEPPELQAGMVEDFDSIEMEEAEAAHASE